VALGKKFENIWIMAVHIKIQTVIMKTKIHEGLSEPKSVA
jgi:hypothetical protein